MTVAVAVLAALAVILAVALAVVTTRWRGAGAEAAAAADAAAKAEAAASQATASASEATTSVEAASARAREAEARVAEAQGRARAADTRADEAEIRAAAAEARASAAEARAAAALPTSGDTAIARDPVVEAVWALEQLRVTLARRDLARISTAASESGVPAGLVEAIGEEVGRIREEIGTPGELRAELAGEPPPAVALLVLRATQTLLPILTRRSDAYDLLVTGGGPQVDVSVACDGADPAGFPDADTDAVAAAIAGGGGTLWFDRTDDGRLQARLRCEAVR